jgi:hypothetical protein
MVGNLTLESMSPPRPSRPLLPLPHTNSRPSIDTHAVWLYPHDTERMRSTVGMRSGVGMGQYTSPSWSTFTFTRKPLTATHNDTADSVSCR